MTLSTFTIKASWIKEIREGHNSNYGYCYNEYVFNENYPASVWLRIPINAPGIRAMEYCDSGIEAEYNQVYLDNNGAISTLFDVERVELEAVKSYRDELACKLKDARDEIAKLNRIIENRKKNEDTLQDLFYRSSATVSDLEKKNTEHANEIIRLKAKLYDLSYTDRGN